VYVDNGGHSFHAGGNRIFVIAIIGAWTCRVQVLSTDAEVYRQSESWSFDSVCHSYTPLDKWMQTCEKSPCMGTEQHINKSLTP